MGNIALSMIYRRIISLYFYWDFFNVFLGGVIGSAGITLLVQNFGKLDLNSVLNLFGRAIMSNSNFFISYVSLRAFLMIPFKLLFPHPAVLCWTFRHLLSKTYCCAMRCNLTFRDKYVIWAPKSFMYGKESGIFLLIGMMGAIYAVSAPLILVSTAVYFSFAFIVFKHHLLYVYGRAYESGGVYWPILFTRMMILLISMACLTGVQMIIKQALWPALAVLPAPFLLLYFMSTCNKQFHNQVNFVPLEIAKACLGRTSHGSSTSPPSSARSLPGGTPSQERRGKATVCRCGRCRRGVAGKCRTAAIGAQNFEKKG